MKPSIATITLMATIVCASSFASRAAVLNVPGNANIFGAGHAAPPAPSGGGAGSLPPGFSFASAPGLVLTFGSVTGTVDFAGGQGLNGPDGFAGSTEFEITSFGGIAGFRSNHGAFLTGVFLNNSEPADPAPASLDFRDAGLGTNFGTLSPLLNQTFYIGDGLTGTGTGSVQNFQVPSGATRLFLGLGDSFGASGAPGGYGDNSGAFVANFTVGVPEPAAAILALFGAAIFAGQRCRSKA